MNQLGNKELLQAIDDLNHVNSEGHGKSGTYQRMERALTDLTRVIEKYYPHDGQGAPALTDEALAEIRGAYSEAIRRCGDYTRGKGDSRRSGYGQGRLNCVREIARILDQDMVAISGSKGRDRRTLPELISRARISETQITEEELSFAKGGMTNRIPLGIQTSGGTCEGFFTPDKKQPTVFQLMEELKTRYHFDITKSPLAELVKDTADAARDAEDGGKSAWELLFAHLAFHRSRIKKLNPVRLENIRNNPGILENYFQYVLTNLIPDDLKRVEFVNNMRFHREYSKTLYDFVMMSGELYGAIETNRDKGRIEEGEDIPKRNVAVSRMADALGMGNLVARAERMEVKDKDGNVIHGVFMEKATGHDVSRLPEDDPLRELTDKPEMLDDADLLRQLSDIQAMDYIVGNVDRHEGNLIYQMEEVNGEMKLVGFKAIDNDMAMGDVSRAHVRKSDGHYVTTPEDMKVIREATADAIRTLDENKIKLMYQDMHFTDKEMKAAVQRVKDMQEAIRLGIITVLKDEQFKNYRLDTLRNRGNRVGENLPRRNIFDIVGGMALKVKNYAAYSRGGEVKYNAAKSIEKQFDREGVIHASDLEVHLDLLQGVRDNFIKSDIKVHRDTGSFKLMKTTMNDCIAAIEEMQAKYPEGGALSAEDTEKMERVYRQLRNASAAYDAGHANPSSPMGQARKAGSLTMKNLWPPRLTPPKQQVKEIDLNEMMNRNGIQDKDKSRERQGSRQSEPGMQANASVISGDEDDSDFVIEGEETGSKKKGTKPQGSQSEDSKGSRSEDPKISQSNSSQKSSSFVM